MKFMFLTMVKPGWVTRLKGIKMSQRKFCDLSGVNYNTWRHMKNPTYNLMQHIESELTKLENVNGR